MSDANPLVDEAISHAQAAMDMLARGEIPDMTVLKVACERIAIEAPFADDKLALEQRLVLLAAEMERLEGVLREGRDETARQIRAQGDGRRAVSAYGQPAAAPSRK